MLFTVVAIEYLLIALELAWATYNRVAYYHQVRSTIYDNWTYKTIIEEPTGRSWRIYADGHIEVLTEGTND